MRETIRIASPNGPAVTATASLKIYLPDDPKSRIVLAGGGQSVVFDFHGELCSPMKVTSAAGLKCYVGFTLKSKGAIVCGTSFVRNVSPAHWIGPKPMGSGESPNPGRLLFSATVEAENLSPIKPYDIAVTWWTGPNEGDGQGTFLTFPIQFVP
jgi:hypothetical protein